MPVEIDVVCTGAQTGQIVAIKKINFENAGEVASSFNSDGNANAMLWCVAQRMHGAPAARVYTYTHHSVCRRVLM